MINGIFFTNKADVPKIQRDLSRNLLREKNMNTEIFMHKNFVLGVKDKCIDYFQSEKIIVALDGYIANVDFLKQKLKVDAQIELTNEGLIVLAYQRWGKNFISKIEGCLTVILWDNQLQQLLIYRDRTGVNSVFWAKRDGVLVVSSDIPGILNFDLFPKKFRKEKLFEFMALRYISGPETLYSDIDQIDPGQLLEWDLMGNIRISQYWDLKDRMSQGMRTKNINEYTESIDKIISHNMHLRVQQFPDLGIMFSGGLDSAYLVAVAQQYLDTVNTFSIGFSEDDPDLQAVDYSQEFFNMKQHNILITNKEFSDNLPHAIKNFNFPLNHPNYVARDILFKKAKEVGITNMIAGEGSDTIFGGAWYIALRKYLLVKKMMPFNILKFFPFLRDYRKFKIVNKVLMTPIDDLIIFDKAYTDRADVLKVLGQEKVDYKHTLKYIYNELAGVSNLDDMDQAFYLALKTTLAIYPRDQRIMSFSNGVNLEYPLLDRNILEYAYMIPARIKLKGFNAKYIFKLVAEKRLPPQLIQRKKYGLPVPLAKWFRDQEGMGRYIDFLTDDKARERKLFNYKVIEELIQEFKKGNDRISEILWVLVNLELWQRIFIEEEKFT